MVVKLRKKKERTGKISLFLDKYDKGKRTYEYLRMYLTGDKKEDEITLSVAQRICEERNEQLKQRIEEHLNDDIANITIHRFIDLHCPLYRKLKLWIDGQDKIKDIDKNYERLFVDRITKSKLNPTTQKNYINIFRAIKNKAIDLDAIPLYKSPSTRIKDTAHERMFLSVEELRKIADAEMDNELHRVNQQAFLFSALTGLRVSDLRELRWEDIRETNGYTRLVFRQRKTKQREYLDISENARKYLGERGTGKVFKGILCNKTLAIVIRLSGIDKHITWHCGRHTFAIMMLGLGVDIYTLSKLLGHSDIAVTQVYARILDKGKRSAVDLIPKI